MTMTMDRPNSTERREFNHELNNHLTALIGELDLARIALTEDHPVRGQLARVLETADRLVAALDRRQALFRGPRRVREALFTIDDLLGRLLGSTPFEHETVGREEQPGIPAAPGQLEVLLLSLAGAGRFLHGPDRPLVLLSGYAADAGSDAARPFALRIQHDSADRRAITPGPYDLRLESAAEAASLAPGCRAALAVVDDLGGTLHHDVSTGHDSTITAYLPLPEPAKLRPAAGPAHGRSGRRRTILVVDDDSLMRGFLRQSLERAGFGVCGASDANEALEMVAGLDRPVDLLIIDLVLPGMHGGLLGPQLAQVLQQPPTLYMSGYDDEAIRHHRLLAPGTPLLHKPFDRATLLERIAALLARSAEEEGPPASHGAPRQL